VTNQPRPSKTNKDGSISYEYITFIRIPRSEQGKTQVWGCVNSRSRSTLGGVFYYPFWRQYCFNPTGDHVILSTGCLADIQDFISRCPIETEKVPDQNEGANHAADN